MTRTRVRASSFWVRGRVGVRLGPMVRVTDTVTLRVRVRVRVTVSVSYG